MKTLKNICLLITCSLQCSTFCYSQNFANNNSNIRIVQMVNPVNILRVHSSQPPIKKANDTIVVADDVNKNVSKALTNLLVSDNDTLLLKLANYCKSLEKAPFESKALTAFIKNKDKNRSNKISTEPFAGYSNDEIQKLIDYFKSLKSISDEIAKVSERDESTAITLKAQALKRFQLENKGRSGRASISN
jgi:hypothetical protein